MTDWGSISFSSSPPQSPCFSITHTATTRLACAVHLSVEAVGGRVLAVTGTFQKRSHPVNPPSLDPTVHPPDTHTTPPQCQLLFSLLHHHQHPSMPHSLPPIVASSLQFSLPVLVRHRCDTAISKVYTVRMRLKDECPPHARSSSQAQKF